MSGEPPAYPTGGVPAQQMYNVVVPAGIAAGDTFQANVDGVLMNVVCPAGVAGGMEVQIPGPPQSGGLAQGGYAHGYAPHASHSAAPHGGGAASPGYGGASPGGGFHHPGQHAPDGYYGTPGYYGAPGGAVYVAGQVPMVEETVVSSLGWFICIVGAAREPDRRASPMPACGRLPVLPPRASASSPYRCKPTCRPPVPHALRSASSTLVTRTRRVRRVPVAYPPQAVSSARHATCSASACKSAGSCPSRASDTPRRSRTEPGLRRWRPRPAQQSAEPEEFGLRPRSRTTLPHHIKLQSVVPAWSPGFLDLTGDGVAEWRALAERACHRPHSSFSSGPGHCRPEAHGGGEGKFEKRKGCKPCSY